jgi:hypothetical protein
MHAGSYRCTMNVTLGVIIAVGSLYSYISKQLATCKQEIISQAAKTKLYLRSALIQQPEYETVHLNKNLAMIR